MRGTRAAFSSNVINSGSLTVVVVMGVDVGTTITNDVEAVVEALHELHGGLDGKLVIYRDTDGEWDEIEHEGGRFKRFAPIRLHSLEASIEYLAHRHALK